MGPIPGNDDKLNTKLLFKHELYAKYGESERHNVYMVENPSS